MEHFDGARLSTNSIRNAVWHALNEPVCRYLLTRKPRCSTVCIDNSLGPLATESPCTNTVYFLPIMQILRNMLYRGSEVMREVGWVVFDEIHYMRDKERGVVWEETLILLPDNVHYVFLSATIPNARQFAEWVTHLHHQPCHVIYTDYRPVPLQHYMFPAGGEGIHLVVDENVSVG